MREVSEESIHHRVSASSSPDHCPNPIRSSGPRDLTHTRAHTHARTHTSEGWRETQPNQLANSGQTPSELDERPRLAGPPAETNPPLKREPLEQQSTAEAPSLPVKHADRASWGPCGGPGVSRGNPETLVSQIFKMNTPISAQASKASGQPKLARHEPGPSLLPFPCPLSRFRHRYHRDDRFGACCRLLPLRRAQ